MTISYFLVSIFICYLWPVCRFHYHVEKEANNDKDR